MTKDEILAQLNALDVEQAEVEAGPALQRLKDLQKQREELKHQLYWTSVVDWARSSRGHIREVVVPLMPLRAPYPEIVIADCTARAPHLLADLLEAIEDKRAGRIGTSTGNPDNPRYPP